MPLTWHPVCSLIDNLQDWLPGVAGTDPRLGYRFWGVNYEKGGLHQPPFLFPRPVLTSQPAVPRESTMSSWPEQILASGILPRALCALEKNERPLGGSGRSALGMRVLQSEVSSGVPAVPLRSRAAGTTHRSKQVTTVVVLQKTQPTSDYLSSLCSTTSAVDSSPDSF